MAFARSKLNFRFSVIIFFVCLLFTFLVWDHYFNSERPLDRRVVSNVILFMGILFSFGAGSLARMQERTLEDLEKSRNFVDNVIRSMADSLIVLNPDATIRSVNRTTLNLLSYQESQLTGKPFHVVMEEAFKEGRSGSNHWEEEDFVMNEARTYITREGKKIPMSFSCSAMRDSAGQLEGIVCVAQDLRERKRLQEQLYQAQRLESVGLLAGGIAHDFGNFLTVIKGSSEIMERKLPQDSPLHRQVDLIQKVSDRAAKLIMHLLTFSRKQVIQPRVLYLNEVIINLDKMLRRLIGEDIELVGKLTEKIGCIKADEGQIEQVLLNLTVNARDAMPRGGRILIGTRSVSFTEKDAERPEGCEPGDYVLLTVTDSGCGMSEEVQSRIFEPFFTTKEEGRGTGLGLSTSFGIIKQCHGTIEVKSQLGRGTTFNIFFPVVNEPLPSKVIQDIWSSLPQGHETILAVEDDSEVREFACDVLMNQGYEVLQASNGREALAYIRDNPERKIDLIFTDVVMPKMGGKELVDQTLTDMPHVKVLFTSGHTNDEVIRRGVHEGRMTFLQKPYSVESLALKVREVLDHK